MNERKAYPRGEDDETLPLPVPATQNNRFSALYETFYAIPVGNVVWVLHNSFIQKGLIEGKKITIIESRGLRKNKGQIEVSTSLEMTIKIVANPAVEGFTYLEITDGPIALTKEDLIKLITLA